MVLIEKWCAEKFNLDAKSKQISKVISKGFWDYEFQRDSRIMNLLARSKCFSIWAKVKVKVFFPRELPDGFQCEANLKGNKQILAIEKVTFSQRQL